MIESIPGFRTLCEYSHALRPENVLLRKPLSDLREGYTNRFRCAQGAEYSSMKERRLRQKRTPCRCPFLLARVDKKDAYVYLASSSGVKSK